MKTKLRISFGSRRHPRFAGRSPLALLGILVALFGTLSLLPPTAAATASDWSLAEPAAPPERPTGAASLAPIGERYDIGMSWAPNAGTLTVTILNEDPAQSNHVIAFYDHNASNIQYLSGHYVGARICASGGTVTGTTAMLYESVGPPDVPFPAYDGDNDENEFELGRNESVTRDLGDLGDGECALAYYYIFVPRFKDGGTESPQSPADGMTQAFAIEATGDSGAVSASDASTIEMDQAISASSNKIDAITTAEADGFLTITVDFDLGNPGSEQNATFNPTAWVGHDAGIFDLVGVRMSIPGQPISDPTDDVLFVNGLTSNNTDGTITYTLQVVGVGATEFFPVDVVHSGQQDKYNGDVGTESTGAVGPVLTLSKSCVPELVVSGNNFVCTITYNNTGSGDAESIAFQDDYDETRGSVSDITPSFGVDDGDVISWTVGTIPAGTGGTLSYTYTVDSSVPGGTTIINTVTTYARGEPQPLSASDSVDVVSPTISIAKTADPTVILSGDPVWYYYQVTASGTPLTDTNVTDDKCTSVGYVSGDANTDGVLDLTETWRYTCTMQVTADVTNTATATGQPADNDGDPLPDVDPISDQDTASVEVVHPAINVVKTANPTLIYAGDTVVYNYTVTNPGDVPLGNVTVNDNECSSPSYQGGDTDGDGLLDTDETWTYTCSQAVTADTPNTATASGQPSDDGGNALPGIGRVMDQDTAFVDTINPGVSVDKTPSATLIDLGDPVTYTYTVDNTGDDPLTAVVVTDTHCSPVTGPAGDTNSNDVLDVVETWTYSCTTTLSNDTTNTAIVTGTDSLSNPITDTHSAFVDVVIAGIQVDKTASADIIYRGGTVIYTYVVSNTGSDVLTPTELIDDHCSPVLYQSGDDNGNGKLETSETWIYTCTTTLDADTLNTAIVSATDPLSNTLSDQSSADVNTIDPAITVAKSTAPTVILTGDTVVYTYTVTNAGDDPLSNVDVVDDKCSPVNYVSGDDSDGVLGLGETWIYTCSTTISDDTTNTATASGDDSLDNSTTDQDNAIVDVVTPTIEVAKTANPTVTLSGGSVSYLYQVTNPDPDSTPLASVNVTDDSCAPVTGPDPTGDANSNGLLDSGETWVFQCTTPVMADTTNTATASGQPSDDGGVPLPGIGPVSKQDTANVDVVAPDIEVVKTADPTIIYAGETVVYTYTVTNPGDVPLGSVEVNDSDCTPSYESGDTDSDNLLDTDETWIYTCTTTLSGDKTNTVDASGKPSDESGSPLPGINRVSDQDTAFVNVINPGLSIDKTPSATKVDPGDTVTYTYTVANTGDDPLSPIVISDDTCASVTGPSGDDGNNVLDVGETWTYSCTTTLSNDTTNTAIVTGTDSLDKEWPEQDTAFVDVIIAGIQIDKTASAYTIYAGNTVTYTYVVSNTGGNPITDVVVLDDHCDPAVYQSGDTNDDGWLDPGEQWIYECSTSLTGDTTNIATASGEDEQGDPVPEDQSSASVDVINPEIAVAKSADPTVVLAGTLVQYTYKVSNPGDDPLRSTWVSDDSCDPVNYVSGDDGNTRLDPGEVWIYECSATINDDTTNIVTARGLDSLGYWASATDDEFVDVVTPTIEIIKSADPTFILPGERVQYTYQVSNPGDVPLEYVSVIDNPICAPITLDPAGDVNGNDLLDPGEIWFFQCTQAVVADTINVATAIGLPVYGAGGSQPSIPVSDQDTASVEVGEEQVSPVGGATMPNNPLWSVFLRVGLAALVGLSLTGGAVVVRRKRGRK